MKQLTTQKKQLVIDQLKKTPIVQVVCEKTGVGRSTYYRWRKEDSDFKKATNKALKEGSLLVNDLAESQLISAIKDKNLTAIIFWLKYHHPAYTTRVELRGSVDHKMETLTPKQEQLINKALSLANSLTLEEIKENKNDK